MAEPPASYFAIAASDHQPTVPGSGHHHHHHPHHQIHHSNGHNHQFSEFQKRSEARAFSLGRMSSNADSISSADSQMSQDPPSLLHHSSSQTSSGEMEFEPHSASPSFDSEPKESRSGQNPPVLRKDVSLVPGFDQLSHGVDGSAALSAAVFDPSMLSMPSLTSPPRQRVPSPSTTAGRGNITSVGPDTLRNWVIDSPSRILLLDVRTASQYSQSHICGSLNICISGILLKRKSFNVAKIADMFQSADDKKSFGQWANYSYIVTYNDGPSHTADASAPANMLKKFGEEKFCGKLCTLEGGFPAFARLSPSLVNARTVDSSGAGSGPSSGSSIGSSSSVPCLGGCPMPKNKSVANPFFGNIRQNEELRGGVVKIAPQVPQEYHGSSSRKMPAWLHRAADLEDGGGKMAQVWYTLERAEQTRLMDAFGCKPPGATHPGYSPARVEMAGIEQGAKNRYHNILPYRHSQVKLQHVRADHGDYVNASAISSSRSKKRYIATQGPLPSTFADFWQLVWEQDVRVVIMLTMIQEGPQIKCHNYWAEDQYGPWLLKSESEERISLKLSPSSSSKPLKSPSVEAASQRPSLGPRSRTAPNHTQSKSSSTAVLTPAAETEPHVIIRRFILANVANPKQKRRVVQLHYNQWPDFGTPAHASHVLGVIQRTNEISQRLADEANHGEGEDPNAHPKIVHCSAGCGRTGTFCTIDTVIDELKQQQRSRTRERKEGKRSAREKDQWLYEDGEDLVAQTVGEFRDQRLSMVQHQRQFVLCYEAVMEWLARNKSGLEATSPNSGGAATASAATGPHKKSRPALGSRGATTGSENVGKTAVK